MQHITISQGITLSRNEKEMEKSKKSLKTNNIRKFSKNISYEMKPNIEIVKKVSTNSTFSGALNQDAHIFAMQRKILMDDSA